MWVCTCTFKHHISFLGGILIVCEGGVCMYACAMACAWDQVTPCRGKGLSTHVGMEHQSEPSHWPPQVIRSPASEPLVPSHPVLWVMLLPAWVSTDLLSVLRIYPEVGLLGHRVILILVFEEPPHCFPERLRHFVRHTRGFQFPSVWYNTTLPVFCLFVCFDSDYSSDYRVIAHCSFDCIFPDD